MNKNAPEQKTHTSASSCSAKPKVVVREPVPRSVSEEVRALVDAKFYYQNYPDVKASGVPADEHYLTRGWIDGRDPNGNFETAFYIKQYPELDEKLEESPLEHFIRKGRAEGAMSARLETLFRNYDGVYQELYTAALPGKDVRAVAWYLPQFHPIAENDLAWGNGFTEWTNVAAARPRFDGHRHPRLPGALGFYDLRCKETVAEQIALAKHAGIYGFCLHYYWFNGKKVLHTPLEHWKNDPSLDFPFCIHWANEPWTRRWDGGSQEVIIPQHHSAEDDLLFIQEIAWALRDTRCMRFQGKPMLGVYRPDLFPDIKETIARWRAYCLREGIGEIFLFASQSFANAEKSILAQGFDASVEYPPHGTLPIRVNEQFADKNLKFSGTIRGYQTSRNGFLARTAGCYENPRFRGVMPGWDNSARTETGTIFAGETPDLYQEWLEIASDRAQKDSYQGEKYLFINAWNEWAEAAYLEPDTAQGYAAINATAVALGRKQDLPEVLLVCDVEKTGMANWLERILVANAAAPKFRPVVLSPRPVRSTGSFRGLAPLLSTFERVDSIAAKRFFASRGYMSFCAAVLLTHIPFGLAGAVASLSTHAVVHTSAKNIAKPLIWHKNLWTSTDSGNDLAGWKLQSGATEQQASLGGLLRESRAAQRDACETSVIVVPGATAEIQLCPVTEAIHHAPFPMEIVIPDAVQGEFPAAFHLVKAAWKTRSSYIAEGIRKARGKYLWFFFPEDAVASSVPTRLRAPFIEPDIVCVRAYASAEKDVVPHVLGRETMKLNGKAILDAAIRKGLPLHPQSLFALYRRDALLEALASVPDEPDADAFFEALVRAVYEKGNVGVVPVPDGSRL